VTIVTWIRGGIAVAAVMVALRLALRVAFVLLGRLLRVVEWVFPFLTPGTQISRSDRAMRIEITRKRQIRRAARRVVRQSRRLFSPQLVVVRVVAPIWPQVVRRFASVSSLVITDISELSDNLLWEIETLKPASHKQWIFVAHRRPTEDPRSDSDLYDRLAHALVSEPVLLYGDSPEEMSRFATALATAIRA